MVAIVVASSKNPAVAAAPARPGQVLLQCCLIAGEPLRTSRLHCDVQS
jgi:hypothetical protein